MKALKWTLLAAVVSGAAASQWVEGPAAPGWFGALALLTWLWYGGRSPQAARRVRPARRAGTLRARQS